MNDFFSSGLDRLITRHGVRKAWLHRGGKILRSSMSSEGDFGNQAEFIKSIEAMVMGYEQVGRHIDRFVFGYREGVLVIAHYKKSFLTFLLKEESMAESVLGDAFAFMEKHVLWIITLRTKLESSEDVKINASEQKTLPKFSRSKNDSLVAV